jgi:hypothetical protein
MHSPVPRVRVMNPLLLRAALCPKQRAEDSPRDGRRCSALAYARRAAAIASMRACHLRTRPQRQRQPCMHVQQPCACPTSTDRLQAVQHLLKRQATAAATWLPGARPARTPAPRRGAAAARRPPASRRPPGCRGGLRSAPPRPPPPPAPRQPCLQSAYVSSHRCKLSRMPTDGDRPAACQHASAQRSPCNQETTAACRVHAGAGSKT